MNIFKNLIIAIIFFCNLFIFFLYFTNRNNYYPQFNFHPNLAVTISPNTLSIWPQILNSKIYKENGDAFSGREELIQYFNTTCQTSPPYVNLLFRFTEKNFIKDILIENIKLKKLDLLEFIAKYGLVVLTINALLLFALYFYSNSVDFHITIFLISISLFFLAFLELNLQGDFEIIYSISVALYPLSLINLGRSVTGRSTNYYIWILEAVIFGGLVLLYYSNYSNYSSYLMLIEFNFGVFCTAFLCIILFYIYNIIKLRKSFQDWIKYFWLILIFLLSAGLPVLMFHVLKINNNFLIQVIFYFSFFVLPLGILVINYKYRLFPLRRIFNHSLIYTIVLVIISVFYAVLIYFYNFFLPGDLKNKEIFVHIIFLSVLVFLLDPIQSRVSRFFKREIFLKESELTSKLKQIALLVTNPGQIEKSISNLLNHIQLAIGIKKITLFLSPEIFPNLKPDEKYIVRSDKENPIWELLSKHKKLISVQHIRILQKKYLRIYRYMFRENYEFAFPLNTPGIINFNNQDSQITNSFIRTKDKTTHACLLVSGKEGGKSFLLEEIRFLNQAASLFNMLFENYIFYMANIEKIKKEHELELSSEIQMSLLPYSEQHIKDFDIEFFSIPASGVTGDYLDIFKISKNEIIILMGDVTGHGLGSAYLMTASRSLIRALFHYNMNLCESMNKLNNFLLNRYGGYELMSLFAGKLNIDTGRMEYVNAGHPPPFYYKKKTKRLYQIKHSQRLLGVFPIKYQALSLKFDRGDLLYLYSDGLVELFNSDEKTFGHLRLSTILRKSNNKNLSEFVSEIIKKLKRFKRTCSWSDDTSFLVIRKQ
jgi:protein phosphatase